MPTLPFTQDRIVGISKALQRTYRQQQIESVQGPATVPQTPTIQQRFVEPPPPVVFPTAQPATNQATVTLLSQLVSLMEKVSGQLDVLNRFQWLGMIASNSNLPTRTETPIPGSAGNGALYTTTFTPFYKNTQKFPLAIIIRATWTTPGGGLNFAYAGGTPSIITTLTNGGVNGGTFSSPLLVMPGQTIWMSTNGIPLAATDTFFVGVMDFAKYIKADAFGAEPFGG